MCFLHPYFNFFGSIALKFQDVCLFPSQLHYNKGMAVTLPFNGAIKTKFGPKLLRNSRRWILTAFLISAKVLILF